MYSLKFYKPRTFEPDLSKTAFTCKLRGNSSWCRRKCPRHLKGWNIWSKITKEKESSNIPNFASGIQELLSNFFAWNIKLWHHDRYGITNGCSATTNCMPGLLWGSANMIHHSIPYHLAHNWNSLVLPIAFFIKYNSNLLNFAGVILFKA